MFPNQEPLQTIAPLIVYGVINGKTGKGSHSISVRIETPMGSALRYWQLERDGMGQQRVEEVPIAKAFFCQQFADLSTRSNISDASIQKQ